MAQDNSIWTIKGFLRWRQASSAASPEYLLLDGGELTNHEINDGKPEAQTHFMASTIVIDLRKSWTNATVAVAAVYDKPKTFPYARRPYLWYNPYTGNIDTTGGWSYADGYALDGWAVQKGWELNTPPIQKANSLWSFALPGPNSLGSLDDIERHWTANNTDLVRLVGKQTSDISLGAGVATPDYFFGLGGYESSGNAISQLLQYDLQSGSITNITASGFGPKGYGAENQAIFTPLFGKQGVILYIGGYSPRNGKINDYSSEGLQDMNNIIIYDIAQETFLTQTATVAKGSSKPRERYGFCAVSASQEGSSTVDIFIHGGVFASGTDTPFEPSFAKVYILSLPSFVWTEVPHSLATPRSLHSCQLIGNRQMAVLGGDDSRAGIGHSIPDPWPNGIGIFDVSAWRWSSKYDHTAKPYQRAQQLVDMSNRRFTAQTWNSEAVGELFNVKQPSTDGSSGADQGASNLGDDGNSDESGSNAGPIAGGVVGALLGLSLIALAVWFFLRRRRKNERYRNDKEAQQSSRNPSSANETISPVEGNASEPSSAYPTDTSSRSKETRWPAELENKPVVELESPTNVAELYSPTKTFTDPGSHPAERQQAGVSRPSDHFTSAEKFEPQEVHEIGSSHIPGRKPRRPRIKR